jgi:predicted Zn-dependent protease
MDGVLRRWALVGAVAVGLAPVGCRLLDRGEPDLPTATMPMAGLTKSGFGGGAKPKFGPPPEQVPVREARKKGQPFKPETLNAWGDAELDAAFDDARTGADRDQLIDVARKRYLSALQQDPKNREAMLGLAKMYTWAGDKDRAVQTLHEMMKQHPKDKDAAFALVRTYVTFQDWDAATKAGEAALALDPANRTYTKSLGYALARANRWDDAFAALLRNIPESEARVFLGRVLIDAGRPGEAAQQLEMVVQKDPTHAVAQSVLASLRQPADMAANQQLEQAGYVMPTGR